MPHHLEVGDPVRYIGNNQKFIMQWAGYNSAVVLMDYMDHVAWVTVEFPNGSTNSYPITQLELVVPPAPSGPIMSPEFELSDIELAEKLINE